MGGGAAVSVQNRKIGLGINTAYYARTYIVSSQGGVNQIAFWKEDTETSRIQDLEINTSIAGKLSEQMVLVGGFNDWLAHSGARYPFLAFRLASVDQPLSGAYRSYGGIELDLESRIADGAIGMNSVGLSGDVLVISELSLRGGYRYDFFAEQHVPALGFGLDDGSISIDYGTQFRMDGNSWLHWHSLGLRIRL